MSIGLLINTDWEPGAVNRLYGFGCTEGSFVVVEAVSPFPGDSTLGLSELWRRGFSKAGASGFLNRHLCHSPTVPARPTKATNFTRAMHFSRSRNVGIRLSSS